MKGTRPAFKVFDDVAYGKLVVAKVQKLMACGEACCGSAAINVFYAAEPEKIELMKEYTFTQWDSPRSLRWQVVRSLTYALKIKHNKTIKQHKQITNKNNINNNIKNKYNKYKKTLKLIMPSASAYVNERLVIARSMDACCCGSPPGARRTQA